MLARIVIPTFNGRHWLDTCLPALEPECTTGVEVVVVDDGSRDGTVGWLRDRFSWVHAVGLERNAGFAHACNKGAQGSDADYLIFLNNDTSVRRGWLAALIAAAARDRSIGLVTSRIVFRDEPGTIDSAGDGYLRCGGAFKHSHGRPATEAITEREVFGACGAAFLIRRQLWETLGGFDEDFFMVYEDVDLSYRARLLGASVRYAPDAIVEHAGSASLGRSSAMAVFYGQRNLEWTWLKNTPRTLLWRSLWSHAAYDAAALIAYAQQGLALPYLRGKLSALAGLPRTLAKRRAIQRNASADPRVLWNLMQPDWVQVKRREKRFDWSARRPLSAGVDRGQIAADRPLE